MEAPAISPLHFDLLARPRAIQLAGGLPLWLMDIPDTSLVQISCMIPSGTRDQDMPLQAKFATGLMQKGTRSYAPDTIGETIDRLGAQVKISVNTVYTMVTILGLHRTFPQLLHIIHSILTEPLYDDRPFRLAVDQALAGWEIRQQKVEAVAQDSLSNRLYAHLPQVAHIVVADDYRQLTPDHLHDFHRRHLGLNRATLMLTGHFTEAEVKQIDQTFGCVAKAEVPPAAAPVVVAQPKAETLHVKMKRPTLQAGVRMGRLLPPTSHPDHPFLRLAHTILGGYFGSRLETNIRETRGLTYDIHSSFYSIVDVNALCISTETPDEKVPEVFRQIDLEMERMATEPVPEAELHNVKQYLIGNDTRDFEPSFGFARLVLNLIGTGRSLDVMLAEDQAIERATPDDIRRVAARYFRPDEFIRCVAGNE